MVVDHDSGVLGGLPLQWLCVVVDARMQRDVGF